MLSRGKPLSRMHPHLGEDAPKGYAGKDLSLEDAWLRFQMRMLSNRQRRFAQAYGRDQPQYVQPLDMLMRTLFFLL